MEGTVVEDIMHGCSYFENDAELYWAPVKLFEGRGDVRPSTKGPKMSRAAAFWTRYRGTSVDTGRPTRMELQ